MAYSVLQSISDPHLEVATVQATGEGLVVPGIVAGTVLPGGIVAGVDFVTRFSGELTIVPNSASDGVFSVEMLFKHWYGEAARQFTRTRLIETYLTSIGTFSISLSRFNSVVRVALGSLPVDSGGTYTVTQADLDAAMPVELSFRIRAWELPGQNTRRAAQLTALHLHSASVNFSQGVQLPSAVAAQTVVLAPWPTQPAGLAAARAFLADQFHESGTDDSWWSSVQGRAQAVSAMVQRYAPDAPDAIKNEATVRAIGWLQETPAASIASEAVGPENTSYATGQISALRHSGAQAILSPWKERTAGVIG